MNESLEELASLYVLDRLDAPARAAFEARLLDDPGLVALVRELESALAASVHALPPHEPPPALLARIERQLDAAAPAATASRSPAEVVSFPRRWTRFAGWGLAAVIALSLATLAVQSLRPRPVVVLVRLDAGQSTRTELTLPQAATDPDERFVALAKLAEQYWTAPTPRSKASGAGQASYALIDSGSRQGFVAVRQLPSLAAPQRYHLWSRDPSSGTVSDVGVLPLTPAARGLYSFTLAADAAKHASRLSFFITVEPMTDSPSLSSPRGQVVLGAKQSI